MYDRFYYTSDIETAKQTAMANARTEYVWLLNQHVDYTNFDLRYVPNRFESDQAHAWPSHNNAEAYTTWLLPRQYTDTNFHTELLPAKDPIKKITWPNFLHETFTGSDWYTSLTNWLLDHNQIQNEWIWVTDSRIDYSNFNFDWLPSYFDQNYIHCFTMVGTKQLSYTWLVNRTALKNAQYKFYTGNLKFINHADTVVLDMGLDNTDFTQYSNRLRFVGTMVAMLPSAVKRSKAEWLWIISNCCDYTYFNFDYLPDLDQLDHTHCWPSNDQQKGETFLVHVPTYMMLEQFKFNFDHEPVKRMEWPTVYYDSDNLADALKQNHSTSLYSLYTKDCVEQTPTPCLWEKRPVVAMNASQSTALIPRDCVVKKELYEYPYILKQITEDRELMDVIFISYDEPQADQNWHVVKQRCSRAKRLHGIVGMERALEAAAKLSATDFFYAVFAKTRLHESFDFSFVPDYFQKPKHYIFDCINTMNQLQYGHMGIIMYNKNLVLSNIDRPFGLDYTMSWEHAVIPEVSCYGEFNSTPFQTWRTAFRECCKIPYYKAKNPSIEADYRLHIWQTHAEGQYAEWCLKGAQDGVAFYLANKDHYDVLKQTFDWQWLRNYFITLYGDVN